MPGTSSDRKRTTITSTTDPETSTTTTHLTTTIPLRSRASASIEPTLSHPPASAAATVTSHNNNDDAGQEEDDEDSDDEAPEAISLSTSKAQSRATEAVQTKAIKDAEERARSKRRGRQEKLEEQAKERQVKRRKKQAEEEAQAEAEAISDDDVSEEEGNDNNGAEDEDEDVEMGNGYLPASLLAGLSDVRPPTPPLEDQTGEAGTVDPARKYVKKGVLMLPSASRPKDLRLGSYNVSVMEQRNERLAPRKDTTRTNSVRERWLFGRNAIQAATPKVRRRGVKVRSGRVERRAFGAKKDFF